jgi:hypothetical protein
MRIKSFCILNDTLYYSNGDITSLRDFLNVDINSDTGRIVFIGNIIQGIYYGTFQIFGNKGAKKALKYLEKFFTSEHTKYSFTEYNNSEYTAMINQIKYIPISNISYDKDIEILEVKL